MFKCYFQGESDKHFRFFLKIFVYFNFSGNKVILITLLQKEEEAAAAAKKKKFQSRDAWTCPFYLFLPIVFNIEVDIPVKAFSKKKLAHLSTKLAQLNTDSKLSSEWPTQQCDTLMYTTFVRIMKQIFQKLTITKNHD